MTNITLRPATTADQPTINTIIRKAGINPLGLRWERFTLAESDGQIIATGQLKPHDDGSTELASIAVIPTQQGQGIGSLMVRTLIDQYIHQSDAPLYLTCEDTNQGFYEQFGFQRVHRDEMPRYFRRLIRIVNLMIRIGRIIQPHRTGYVAVMRRE